MIVPMKKAQIVVLKDEYDQVIKSLQQYGVIMIINKEGGDSSISLELNEALQQRVQKMLTVTKKYEPKKTIFGDYQTIDIDSFNNVSKDALDLLHEIERLLAENESLSQEIKEKKELIKSLQPWELLDEIPIELKNTKYVRIHIGSIPTKNQKVFLQKMNEENYEYSLYGTANQGVHTIISCFYEDDELLKELLKQLEFNDVRLPEINYQIKDYLAELNRIVAEKEEIVLQNKNKLNELSMRNDELRVLSDQILTQEALNNISCEITKETKIIEGWVRIDTLESVEKAIQDVTKFYEMEFTDPKDGEKVPTCAKNKRFPAQFETITDMFSKPSQNDIDPNPAMSIWYWVLFGMMMGDVGYGLVMILCCILFKKIAKPRGNTLKLVNIIMYSGIPTIFWGIIFGSYFGFNPNTDFGWKFVWYWFSPMNDPIKMLVLSVAVGAFHLITGLVIKCIICIRDKDYAEMLSKNVSWICIILGIGSFALGGMVINNSILKMIGIILIIVGVALIILLSGVKKKSIFKKAVSGVLGLYDITSYLSDLLSYSRIMALTMSSAAVAMVMNTLASMIGGTVVGMFFAAIIFVVGHLFNIVLGLLSAYVHDSRLQYIEFFGKFYEGGGIDFKPLTIQTKYIKEIKGE